MKYRLAPLLLIVLAPSIPRSTGACALEARDGGRWKRDPIDGDVQAPTQLVADYEIQWPVGDDFTCTCGCPPGPPWIVFHVSAIDDNVSPAALGYRFAIVGGQPPPEFDPESLVLMPSPYANEIGFTFSEDAHHFTFDVQITARDRNGNESAPIVLTIDV